jgi:hypothetical protein
MQEAVRRQVQQYLHLPKNIAIPLKMPVRREALESQEFVLVRIAKARHLLKIWSRLVFVFCDVLRLLGGQGRFVRGLGSQACREAYRVAGAGVKGFSGAKHV